MCENARKRMDYTYNVLTGYNAVPKPDNFALKQGEYFNPYIPGMKTKLSPVN